MKEAAVIKTRNLQITMMLASEFDKIKIQYLLDRIHRGEANLLDICKWCAAQGIDFSTKFNYHKEDRFFSNVKSAFRYLYLKGHIWKEKIE